MAVVFNSDLICFVCMMTACNANPFHITGPSESNWFTSHWWISLTKASNRELWCFIYIILNEVVLPMTPWRSCNVTVMRYFVHGLRYSRSENRAMRVPLLAAIWLSLHCMSPDTGIGNHSEMDIPVGITYVSNKTLLVTVLLTRINFNPSMDK